MGDQNTKSSTKHKRTSVKKDNAQNQNASDNVKDSTRGPSVEAAESLEGGAKAVAEKVSEVASAVTEKTSELATPVFEKVKESASDIADMSKKVLDEISQSAQEYIEKYKHQVEMKKVGEQRKELIIKLGSMIYVRHKVQHIGPENLFAGSEIISIIKDIEKKDKEIIKMGKKMDKQNN
jgi:hypothetical protein